MNTCALHGTTMSLRKVPIMYGMPAYDPAWSVQKELFPNSNSVSLGGCVIHEENPTHVKLFVCDNCREAEQQWRKENDAD